MGVSHGLSPSHHKHCHPYSCPNLNLNLQVNKAVWFVHATEGSCTQTVVFMKYKIAADRCRTPPVSILHPPSRCNHPMRHDLKPFIFALSSCPFADTLAVLLDYARANPGTYFWLDITAEVGP